MNYYIRGLDKYTEFNGRSTRKEFWYFWLFNWLISFILFFILGLISFLIGIKTNVLQPVSYLYSLAVFIPTFAVIVRRLHDIGKSGWWCLINFIPFIGLVWFIVLMCTDSKPGENKYGLNPKGIESK